MKRKLGKLAIVIAFMISGIGRAQAQSAVDQLQPLVRSSALRLLIAERVALAKWDSGTPVEDPSREAQVIAGAVEAGKSRGLDEAVVAEFFRAQIEANKVVQYSLLADWHRLGAAPAHGPINLVNTIRPELDRLQTELIRELANTATIRARKSCGTDIAKAVGKYLARYEQDTGRLQAIALDRSLGTVCER